MGLQLRRVVLLLVALATWTSTVTAAKPRLKKLDIRVELADNGDARITETRHMTVGSDGTECYIVVGNMNGSKVRDLTVSDETGAVYETMDHWDTDWSRSRKEGKCGVVVKNDGYEICWGLGDDGERTYTAAYTVTKLCRSYDDADGFNYMFVAENIKPQPEKARVTIVREGSEGGFNRNDVRMWAFRFHGSIAWDDGAIVAHTSEPLDEGQSMIVMVSFKKGVLHPDKEMNDSFESVKEEAFVGSDYDMEEIDDYYYDEDYDEERQALVGTRKTPFDWSWLIALGIVGLPCAGAGVYAAKKKKVRNLVDNDLLWYRDIPYNGDLNKANQALNGYNYFKSDKQKVINAAVVRLISTGALSIENVYVEAGRLKRMVGGKGKYRDCIVINDLTEQRGLKNTLLITTLYNIFRDASGEDLILQPGELKKWMKQHTSRLVELMNTIDSRMSMKEMKNDIEQVRQVMGLKKFLKEFTLANERHITELGLWKDYLVYAELFGIADQVKADMEKINPEYQKMEKVYQDMNDRTVVPELMATTLYGSRLAQKAIARERSGGGGGSASLGGGGGFSGGGSGGGIR